MVKSLSVLPFTSSYSISSLTFHFPRHYTGEGAEIPSHLYSPPLQLGWHRSRIFEVATPEYSARIFLAWSVVVEKAFFPFSPLLFIIIKRLLLFWVFLVEAFGRATVYVEKIMVALCWPPMIRFYPLSEGAYCLRFRLLSRTSLANRSDCCLHPASFFIVPPLPFPTLRKLSISLTSVQRRQEARR